jgi:hypothetical protein
VGAAAGGDVAELLDVDTHRLARPGAFVAADRPAGGPVERGRAGQAEPGQHTVDRGGIQPQQVGDADRSPAVQDTDLDDPALGAGRGPVRAGARTAGTATGAPIDYVDGTGFTATGDIRDGVLFHEHLVLYREGDQRVRQGDMGSRG